MEAKVVRQTKELVLIEWSGPTGYGELLIKYNGKGGYEVDAEFIGLNTLFEIIKAAKLGDEE